MQKLLLLLSLMATQQAMAQLFVQAGATITTNGNATVCLQNTDLICNGTINQLAGNGRFVYNGAANTEISGTTTPNFALLDLDKTSGATLTLKQHIGVNESIKFNNGIIQLNNYNILLQPTAYLDNESEASRITGITGGYIEITNTLNAPTTVNMGNLGATITSTQNMGSTTIRRGHVSQTASGYLGSSVYRYFDIVPTNNTALNATLNFKYFDAELNSLLEANMVQYKSNDNITWAQMGFTTRDATANFVEKTGLADFSRWTLSNLNSALPITLTNFWVACNNGNKVINFKTTPQVSAASYNIQTSTNGITWSTVATLQAVVNNTNTYQYTYNNAPSTAVYYKIVAVAANGNTSNSAIIKAACNASGNSVKVYPNPVNNTLWLTINNTTVTNANINILNAKGALVLSQKTTLANGVNTIPIQVANLPSAWYQVIINYANGQPLQTVKIIKK